MEDLLIIQKIEDMMRYGYQIENPASIWGINVANIAKVHGL
jgi:hypothetical protein